MMGAAFQPYQYGAGSVTQPAGDTKQMPTLAEMERHATLLVGAAASQLSPWGVVPVSPHIARITALEADVARLLAENVRLAAANAVLQRGAEIIAAADVPPATRPVFPARALARQHQAIGMTCGI